MKFPSRSVVIGIGILASTLLAISCDHLETSLHPDRCELSGRPIHRGMAVKVQVAGGVPRRACCLRCALIEARQTENQVRVLSVTDYVSQEGVRPDQAVYVVDSQVALCAGARVDASATRREAPVQSWDRCLPSTIAFASRDAALQFQTEHGGEVQTFAKLVEGTAVVAAK